ncbi:hypothetical protein EJ07DRAFT_183982 [Lizonia empirigonia]|nr:hypothetical protein EJ07DRAFT_183982 [Lizonia empirigonia]
MIMNGMQTPSMRRLPRSRDTASFAHLMASANEEGFPHADRELDADDEENDVSERSPLSYTSNLEAIAEDNEESTDGFLDVSDCEAPKYCRDPNFPGHPDCLGRHKIDSFGFGAVDAKLDFQERFALIHNGGDSPAHYHNWCILKWNHGETIVHGQSSLCYEVPVENLVETKLEKAMEPTSHQSSHENVLESLAPASPASLSTSGPAIIKFSVRPLRALTTCSSREDDVILNHTSVTTKLSSNGVVSTCLRKTDALVLETEAGLCGVKLATASLDRRSVSLPILTSPESHDLSTEGSPPINIGMIHDATSIPALNCIPVHEVSSPILGAFTPLQTSAELLPGTHGSTSNSDRTDIYIPPTEDCLLGSTFWITAVSQPQIERPEEEAPCTLLDGLRFKTRRQRCTSAMKTLIKNKAQAASDASIRTMHRFKQATKNMGRTVRHFAPVAVASRSPHETDASL